MDQQKTLFRPTRHGWLVLDKPLGLTSTQALGRARRLLGGKKVGHGGTLDPLATGILPLAFGEATKLIPYAMHGDKEYEFSIRWGEARSTDDAEGVITATSNARPERAEIEAALSDFIGLISQIPPAFSAIKVDGERAYDLARAGEAVVLKAREISIHSLELLEMSDGDHSSFRVACSKGMYVRSLARDLAVKLGSCGHVSSLRRTKVGAFSLENACSMDHLEALAAKNEEQSVLLPLKSVLQSIPTLILSPQEAHILRLGQRIAIKPQHFPYMEEKVILAEHDGMPLAMIEPIAGEFRVLRGFHF